MAAAESEHNLKVPGTLRKESVTEAARKASFSAGDMAAGDNEQNLKVPGTLREEPA
jgi:hypothetical protein